MLQSALVGAASCARRAPVCALLRLSPPAAIARGARAAAAAAAAAAMPAAARLGASCGAAFSSVPAQQCSPRQLLPRQRAGAGAGAGAVAGAPAAPALGGGGGGGGGAARGISTKRRRNAAMNRHKLQKLRKRMRKLMAKNVSTK